MAQNPYHSMPFRQFGAANAISASTTSASAALARPADQSVVVSNPIAGSIAFVRFGTSAVVATSADFAVLPGLQRILSVPETATHVAVILNTGTGTVYVSVGDGSVI